MVRSGFYDNLLAQGILKEEDMEPDVGPFSLYLDAFRELSSCRINGMAVGQIPFTAIVEYARLFDIDDFPDFHYLIRLMDDCFLDLELKKSKAAQSTGVRKK